MNGTFDGSMTDLLDSVPEKCENCGAETDPAQLEVCDDCMEKREADA